MEEFKSKYANPFEGLTEDKFQGKCAKIANDLFNNYCIKCNEKEFYFAEIEFYYFQDDVWNQDWNQTTYPKNFEGKGGQLFYHLSGVDVCFDGNLKRENGVLSGKGGGILIRSIVDSSNKTLIIGPLTCANTLLNTCDGKLMPSIQSLKEKRQVNPIQTYRFFGNDDFSKIENGTNRDEKLKLAFYDNTIDTAVWNKVRSKYYEKRLKICQQ